MAFILSVFSSPRLNIAADTSHSELGAVSSLRGQRMRLGGARWSWKKAGRWPKREEEEDEASWCDSSIRLCCAAISQPSSCQLSTMEGHLQPSLYIHGFPRRHCMPAPSHQLGGALCQLSAVCSGSKRKGQSGYFNRTSWSQSDAKAAGLSPSHCADDEEMLAPAAISVDTPAKVWKGGSELVKLKPLLTYNLQSFLFLLSPSPQWMAHFRGSPQPHSWWKSNTWFSFLDRSDFLNKVRVCLPSSGAT